MVESTTLQFMDLGHAGMFVIFILADKCSLNYLP